MKQGLTLQELAAELERQEAAKHDYVADTRRMHFVTAYSNPDNHGQGTRSELDLIGEGANAETEGLRTGLRIQDLAHRQISDYLGIPWRYYDRLHAEVPGLLDTNVNMLLQRAGERRMIRAMDGKVRAFLSDRYRRLDNQELARTVIPILGGIPDCRIESAAITEERMYIKAVTPRVSGEVKVGEEVCAGVYVSNSEVGAGKLRVEPFVYTLECTNGMVVSRELGGIALRRIHVGRRLQADEETYRVFRDETLQADDQAFFMAVADVVRAAVDEVRFRDLLTAMQAAAQSETLTNMVAGVEELAAAHSLNDRERDGVLTHLAQGGDLSRWGVLSAVTRTAEDVDDYDRASELEELGGRVLAYSERDWQRLVTAGA